MKIKILVCLGIFVLLFAAVATTYYTQFEDEIVQRNHQDYYLYQHEDGEGSTYILNIEGREHHPSSRRIGEPFRPREYIRIYPNGNTP